MRILFIGGTRFIGRTMATTAVARGHDVTLFNRGRLEPDPLPGTRAVRGDRELDLGLVSGGSWDAVVDTCGYLPRIVGRSVEALHGTAGRYAFVSSISVFDHSLPAGVDEEGPVKTMPDEAAGTFSLEHYGALKARCEQVVREGFPGRALVVRPGLVIGPGDYSDRFTYWVVRLARGGAVAASDRRDAPVQWIDVRDLAEWTIGALEAGIAGDFNLTGPLEPMPIGEVLVRVAAAVGGRPEFAWLDRATLERERIEPWTDLPLVLPYDGSEDGAARTKVGKAMASGLSLRPLETSARDVWSWWQSLDPPRELRAGLTPEREARLLEAAARTSGALPSGQVSSGSPPREPVEFSDGS